MKLSEFENFRNTKIAKSNAKKDGDFYYWIEKNLTLINKFCMFDLENKRGIK